MTIKEYNAIRHAAYLEAIKAESVQNAFAHSNTVHIYDISEGQKHKVVVVYYQTQMNDELLRQEGFTPAAIVRRVMTLNRTTQAAVF